MSKASVVAGALALLAGAMPAAAQSWGVEVGVGYGHPGYYGPPPVYLYEQPPIIYEEPPIIYERPPVIYEQPPVVYTPAPVVRSAVPPDVVFDRLERAGYSEFGPMAFRDGVYKLRAVNRQGDLVALEVSALDAAVEREFVIGARSPAVRAPAPAAPPPTAPAPAASGEDPLVVY